MTPTQDRIPDVDITIEDGVVVVVEQGLIDLVRSQEIAELAMRAAIEAGTWWLLFDFVAARMPDYHTIAVTHGDHAVDTGLARYRIALVGRPGDPMLTFFETVGVNRGVATRTFATRDDAKRWLRG